MRSRDLLDDGKRQKFEEWLTARGAQVLEPTNEWEVLRFRANGEVSVIYRNKSRQITFAGKSLEAWTAYRRGESWRGNRRTKRRRLSPLVRTLRKRDGGDCFFCGEEIERGEESIEHLVSATHGGPNHVANLVLAHEECNHEAGHLPVIEKVQIRERNLYGDEGDAR